MEMDLFTKVLCPRIAKGIDLARKLHTEAEECAENGDNAGHEEALYAYLSVIKTLAIFCGVTKEEMEGSVIFGPTFRFMTSDQEFEI